MNRDLLINPVLNDEAFDTFEVLHVVGYHSKSCSFGCTTFLHTLYDRGLSPQREDADIGVELEPFHSAISLMWAFRAEYMSSRISSVVLSSSHLPAKEETQSLSACNIEVLSNEISSNLTSSLRSFSFGQYRLMSGDEDFTTDASIITTYFIQLQKYEYFLISQNNGKISLANH